MKEGIKKVCIVGSGTSGWLTAMALKKQTPWVDVTVISPTDIPTIGVGEATIPIVAEFIYSYLGMVESEWMEKCNATYKVSLRFSNFTYSPKQRADTYYNVFEQDAYSISPFDWTFKNVKGEVDNTKYGSQFLQTKMSEGHKFEKRKGARFNYSYNMDAKMFGTLCHDIVKDVITIKDTKVVDVDHDEYGITALHLEDGSKETADLFIDCTGFYSILGKKTLGAEFISLKDYLPNNRAVVTRVGREEDEDIPVYTDCQALGNGWVFTVPLWNRDGTGYIYGDKYINPKEAEEEFREHLLKTYPQKDLSSLKFKHFDFTDNVGYTPTPWLKNCISIGLSSCFVEPIESTALGVTVDQIKNIVEFIKSGDVVRSSVIKTFNNNYEIHMKNIRDFIVLHYSSAKREDTKYWKEIKYNQKIPDSLASLLGNMQDNEWGLVDITDTGQLFRNGGYSAVGICQEAIPNYSPTDLTWDGLSLNFLNEQQKEKLNIYVDDILEKEKSINKYHQELADNMLTHREYLKTNGIYKRI
jgi:tryptophan halogenase